MNEQRIPSIRTVAMPADTNPNGNIFGGWLLSQMDIAGAVHIGQITRACVVTVAVDAMTFHEPVRAGDEVSCYCETVHRGQTSIGVCIETWVRGRVAQSSKKVTEGKFTYVAIDENGQLMEWNKALPVSA